MLQVSPCSSKASSLETLPIRIRSMVGHVILSSTPGALRMPHSKGSVEHQCGQGRIGNAGVRGEPHGRTRGSIVPSSELEQSSSRRHHLFRSCRSPWPHRRCVHRALHVLIGYLWRPSESNLQTSWNQNRLRRAELVVYTFSLYGRPSSKVSLPSGLRRGRR